MSKNTLNKSNCLFLAYVHNFDTILYLIFLNLDKYRDSFFD